MTRDKVACGNMRGTKTDHLLKGQMACELVVGNPASASEAEKVISIVTKVLTVVRFQSPETDLWLQGLRGPEEATEVELHQVSNVIALLEGFLYIRPVEARDPIRGGGIIHHGRIGQHSSPSRRVVSRSLAGGAHRGSKVPE